MKKPLFLFVIIISFLIAPACWDTRDIGKHAFVTAIGIDDIANPTPSTETNQLPLRYQVTTEVVDPSLLKDSARANNPEKAANIIVTSQGPTIEMALELIQAKIPNQLTLNHLNVLLIGEKIGQEHFKNICSYFEKHPDVARRIRVMFVKDSKAIDVLNTKPQLDRYIAEELIAMTEVARTYSLGRLRPFTQLLKELRANNGQTLAARVLISDDNKIIRHGSAVFDNWQLIGWLDANETRKANWLQEPKDMIVIGRLDEGIYSYRVNKKSLKIIPVLENGKVTFNIKLKTTGTYLQEENKYLDLTQLKTIKKMENMFSEVIKKEVKEAIEKSQKDFKVDYFALGMQLKNRYPQIYNDLNWNETFPKVKINVEVETKITSFGLAR